MPTKTNTTTRTAGTLAADRAKVTKSHQTRADGSPVYVVTVDGVELGTVSRVSIGWVYPGASVFYVPKTKGEAVARLVAAAVEAGTVSDMDDAAAAVALDAAAAVTFPEHHETPSERDQADARTAAGYLALRAQVGAGDVVIRPDGRRCRIGHRHEQYGPNRYQPTARPAMVQLTDGGSWWLSLDGRLGSYSGGFEGRVDVADLVDTGERAPASAQMWRDRTPGGGNAFVALVPVKVWQVREDAASYAAR